MITIILLRKNMARRLSRKKKDLTCMRQLALCGYCNRELCDAFEVDHLNEKRFDDCESNLVATCALCHAIKSRHVRLKRDWSSMRRALHDNLATTKDRWRSGVMWNDLPEWLRERVTPTDLRAYACSICPPSCVLDWRRFRYKGELKPTYRT